MSTLSQEGWDCLQLMFPSLGAPGITHLWTDSTHFLLRYSSGGELIGVLGYTTTARAVAVFLSPHAGEDVLIELRQDAERRWPQAGGLGHVR